MPETIPILIADDHVLLAEALAQILSREGDFVVTGARSLKEALDALTQQDFRVVLLDVMMPGMEGMKGVTRMIKQASAAKVVLFSGNVALDFAHKALAAGAAGFIPKTLPLKALPAALRLVDSGQVFLPVTPGDVKPSWREARERNRSALTELQSEILRLVQAGKTNKEIAREISGTETAVKMHLRAVFSKLEAKNRVHAVNIAQSNGLL